MKQELKSERSRRLIMDAALDLFSHRGYGATSVRDIAERALLSTGSVYHHFPDKESIYRALFDEYFTALADPNFPINKALASGVFPDNLEMLGKAAEKSVRKYRKYVALIYVDVVEFDGSHIRKYYEEMAKRFERFVDAHGKVEIEGRLHPGTAAASSVMLATRIFLNYFTVEVLFGVRNHFGKESDAMIREIAGILRRGMLRESGGAAEAAG